MKHLFWILWSIELAFMCWWLWDDLKLKYIQLNPFIIVGFIWLAISLLMRLMADNRIISNVLVIIPAIPLGIMGIFLIIVFLVQTFAGPIRWN
jgi:hypothetical protein